MRNYRTAIQGIEGSYSDSAVSVFLGDAAERISFGDFETTLSAVAAGDADLAVVPTYNSIAGEIGNVNDLIREFGLRKIRLTPMRIEHSLIVVPGSKLEDVSDVVSHPEALRQCTGFLNAHPHLRTIPASDTATAVQQVVEAGDPSKAAIGSRKAAALYGGEVLLDLVADHRGNTTTFCLVKK